MPAFRPGPKGRLKPLKALGADLEGLARELGLENALRLQRLRSNWGDLFNNGPLALHTFPRQLNGSSLSVDVDSPAWLQQVNFLKNEIVSKLKPYGITSLVMRIGRVNRPAAAKTQHGETMQMLPEAVEFIEEVTSEIQDHDLKDHIRSALEAWAKRKKKL